VQGVHDIFKTYKSFLSGDLFYAAWGNKVEVYHADSYQNPTFLGSYHHFQSIKSLLLVENTLAIGCDAGITLIKLDCRDPLPIALQSFEAVVVGHGVQLDWTLSAESTATEIRLVERCQGATRLIESTSGDGRTMSAFDPSPACWSLGELRYEIQRQTAANSWETLASTSVRIPDTEVTTSLGQPRPNPFNPSTTIPFATSRREKVRLSVFDVSGKLVRTLCNQFYEPGPHSVEWDGRDRKGRPASSGTYFVQLVSEGKVETEKMVLVR